MITRPLEIAARLRPEPRNFDWLFFVNGGLILLFFTLFGSPFVLAPGLELTLPKVAGASGSAVAPTHVVRVTDTGQILAPGGGVRSMAQFPEWLRAESRKAKGPVLLVIANNDVRVAILTEIVTAAEREGFKVQWAAVEPDAK
jgi:biopolymer transport protein ExbD